MTTAPAPHLRVRDLTITHDDAARPAVAHVSFDVAPGEVVLVLGPSGAGKSTLALALNGLLPQSIPGEVTGSIRYDDVAVAATPVARLSTIVAMVFQDPDAQVVTSTLLDEVAFGPENLCLPVEEVLARSEAALREVGLWERRDDNPDVLSGGGRQRLAIACALALGSPVLVLDEPSANLDPRATRELYGTLRRLVAAGERSIVLIEHDVDAAIDLVDRVVVLDGEGRLVMDGPAGEVLGERAGELHALGVWLPRSVLATIGTAPRAPRPLARATAAAGATPAVEVRDLTLLRQRTPVLHHVDLTVRAGEVLAVVGENGAGKTSLVQAIAGVLPTPRGTVRAHGRIGFVFQNPEHQLLTATCFDELAHGLRLQRRPESEVRTRVWEMLERFGLADHAEHHPFLLSGGQKRRLSVGTALITGADVLVLDEPTYGQDRSRATELLALLADLNADGTTVVLTTHDLELVREHTDRTLVLADGRVRHLGQTPEVLETWQP